MQIKNTVNICIHKVFSKDIFWGFQDGTSGKESACQRRRWQEWQGSISGSGRSREEGNGSPLQYSCGENPMKRGAWQAAVCWV